VLRAANSLSTGRRVRLAHSSMMRDMSAEEVRRQPAQDASRREQLLAAVIPVPLQRPIPRTPHLLPELPAPRLPAAEPESLVLGMARLDGSGRVHDRAILAALDWHPGRRIDITTVYDTIVVHSVSTGLHIIGARGDLTLPAAARTLSGIPANSRVVLAAIPSENLLLVHPSATMARLLCRHYATMDDGHAD
jgi:hypothetical protein